MFATLGFIHKIAASLPQIKLPGGYGAFLANLEKNIAKPLAIPQAGYREFPALDRQLMENLLQRPKATGAISPSKTLGLPGVSPDRLMVDPRVIRR